MIFNYGNSFMPIQSQVKVKAKSSEMFFILMSIISMEPFEMVNTSTMCNYYDNLKSVKSVNENQSFLRII